jgi:hypothetical protein
LNRRNTTLNQARITVLSLNTGDAAEFAVLEPVGVALEGDEFGVVDGSVDHRGGDGVVSDDLSKIRAIIDIAERVLDNMPVY